MKTMLKFLASSLLFASASFCAHAAAPDCGPGSAINNARIAAVERAQSIYSQSENNTKAQTNSEVDCLAKLSETLARLTIPAFSFGGFSIPMFPGFPDIGSVIRGLVSKNLCAVGTNVANNARNTINNNINTAVNNSVNTTTGAVNSVTNGITGAVTNAVTAPVNQVIQNGTSAVTAPVTSATSYWDQLMCKALGRC